jgi:hypothetical protein
VLVHARADQEAVFGSGNKRQRTSNSGAGSSRGQQASILAYVVPPSQAKVALEHMGRAFYKHCTVPPSFVEDEDFVTFLALLGLKAPTRKVLTSWWHLSCSPNLHLHACMHCRGLLGC